MTSSAYHASPEPAPARPAGLTPDKVATGMRAFFRVMQAWDVSGDAARVLLGSPSRATFFQWKKGEVRRVPHDTVRRISYVLGIWKALEMLFKEPARADAWVHQPNTLLGGRSALERMLAGDVTDLAAVRGLLDSVRGGGA